MLGDVHNLASCHRAHDVENNRKPLSSPFRVTYPALPCAGFRVTCLGFRVTLPLVSESPVDVGREMGVGSVMAALDALLLELPAAELIAAGVKYLPVPHGDYGSNTRIGGASFAFDDSVPNASQPICSISAAGSLPGGHFMNADATFSLHCLAMIVFGGRSSYSKTQPTGKSFGDATALLVSGIGHGGMVEMDAVEKMRRRVNFVGTPYEYLVSLLPREPAAAALYPSSFGGLPVAYIRATVKQVHDFVRACIRVLNSVP